MGARQRRDGRAECLEIAVVHRDHVAVERAREALLASPGGRRSARPKSGDFASYGLAKTSCNLLLFKDAVGTGGTVTVAAPPA
jgi:hypothetical protein